MPGNDSHTKSLGGVHLGRPVSMSSQESETSDNSPYDIAELEKDSEILARKAAKRYKKNYSTQSESFVEKFISWHRRKKVDKIKSSLESLFPKLKNSEVAVKNWLATVSERKEVAWLNGNALLNDMEAQIIVYQKHLDFLDEVINDIRQIDYDILKEVSELRIAFAFNQELLSRASPKIAAIVKMSEKGNKMLTISVDCESLPISGISADFNQEIMTPPPLDSPVPLAEPAVWHSFGAAPTVNGVTSHTIAEQGTDSQTLSSGSSVMTPFEKTAGAAGGGGSDSQRLVSTISSVDDDKTKNLKDSNAVDSSAVGIAVSRSGRVSPKLPLTTASSSSVGAAVASTDRGVTVSKEKSKTKLTEPLLIWDGEESKRKSLTTSCVSLQSLKLGQQMRGESISSPVVNKGGSSWRITSDKASSDKNVKGTGNSNSGTSLLGVNFVRARSDTSNEYLKNSEPNKAGNRNSWSKTDVGLLLQKSFSSPQSSSLLNTAATTAGGKPPLKSQSSSDESGGSNSHSDGDTDDSTAILGIMDCVSASKSSDSNDKYSSNSYRKQQKGSRQQKSVENGPDKIFTKKLSLQKLLQKVDSNDDTNMCGGVVQQQQQGDGTTTTKGQYQLGHGSAERKRECDMDPDQLEMSKRIKKCLALKDTLKSVLTTVQVTQDTETSTLRKMKKLRNELKGICSAEHDHAASTADSANYVSLCQHRLLGDNHSMNENSSGSNSALNSSNNNLHSGYCSDHGSDDSSNGGGSTLINNVDSSSGSISPTTLQRLSRVHRVGSGSGQQSSAVQPHHASSASIPIMPPPSHHRMTPSQTAAVAISGVAAFSFMTSATTGSVEGDADGANCQERLSLGSNSTFGEDLDFHDAALECVDDLKSLIQQETEAKSKLAKLASLIDSASTINQQLNLNIAAVTESVSLIPVGLK